MTDNDEQRRLDRALVIIVTATVLLMAFVTYKIVTDYLDRPAPPKALHAVTLVEPEPTLRPRYVDRQPRASRERMHPSAGSRPAVRVSPAPIAHKAKVTGLSAFQAWRTSAKARSVYMCESGGDPGATNPSGKYRGKWQVDADFWASYGGLAYASTADRASEYQQDLVAYRGWQARGWQPWSCA